MDKIEVNLEIANLDQKIEFCDDQILVEDQVVVDIISEKSVVKRDVGT